MDSHWPLHLNKENADILHSQSAWLNDRIMDATQMLICKTLGDERSYQSVLNTQRKLSIPIRPVNHDYIQLLHNVSSHWFLNFCSSRRIQICDSLKWSLNRVSMKCVYVLHKNVIGKFGKATPTFLSLYK